MRYLIILFLCIGCSQIKKGTSHKTNIDYNLIDFISIKKVLFASDSICFLTEKETRNIITEWNDSEYKGIYKMIPNYWIIVNLKNDSIRTFRSNGNLIKEESDWTYSLSNPNLISSFWKNSEAIPQPPKPPVFIECDSMYKKAETDYKNGIREYTTLGLVEATELEMHYSDYMKRNYSITMKANCVPSLLDECYAQSMAIEIEKEYGENFMQLTREKSATEFKEQRK